MGAHHLPSRPSMLADRQPGATTRSSTSRATATSPSATDSRGSWLIPPAHRTKSIAAGQTRESTTASCPAPLGSERISWPSADDRRGEPEAQRRGHLDRRHRLPRDPRVLDAARRCDRVDGAADRRHAPPELVVVGVADVDREPRPAGDDVRRTGLDVEHADGCNEPLRVERAPLDREHDLARGRERIPARAAIGVVPAWAARPSRVTTARASAPRSPRRRRPAGPLPRARVPARCAPRGTRPARARVTSTSAVRVASRGAHGLGDRDAVVVHELEPRRLEDSRVRGRAEVRDAEARTLLVGERRDLQGGREAAPACRAGDRDPGEHAERPVEAARVGDGVEVRAEDERRLVGGAEPAERRCRPRRGGRRGLPPPSSPRRARPRARGRLVAKRRVRRPDSSLTLRERVGAGEELGGRAVHGVRR